MPEPTKQKMLKTKNDVGKKMMTKMLKKDAGNEWEILENNGRCCIEWMINGQKKR